MKTPVLLAVVTLFCAACSQPAPSMTEKQLVGKWSCDPVKTSIGPGNDEVLTTNTTTEIRADHTWRAVSTISGSMATRQSGFVTLSFRDGSEGAWRLDGDVFVSTTKKFEFLWASHPDVMSEKDWEKSNPPVPYTDRARIISFDGKRREMKRDSLRDVVGSESWACWKL